MGKNGQAAGQPGPFADRETCERTFLAVQTTIDRLCAGAARRFRLEPDEARDFAADVRCRIIADDYAVLRRFRGESGLQTYLAVTIHRHMLDRNNARWGKWRPSKPMRRAGPVAVRFERLTARDGLPFDQACAVLEATSGSAIDRATLARLHQARRPRRTRQLIPLESLPEVPSASTRPDEELLATECREAAVRAAASVERFVRELPIGDRRLLELKFRRGYSIADVARLMRVDAKALYSRAERVLRTLRRRLEDAGFDARDVLAGIGGAIPVGSAVAVGRAPGQLAGRRFPRPATSPRARRVPGVGRGWETGADFAVALPRQRSA